VLEAHSRNPLLALLEEAWRRARRRRIGVAVLGVAAALVALPLVIYFEWPSGGSADGGDTAQALLTRPTRLTIVTNNPKSARAIFHLSCRPVGGDLPNPGQACASLEEVAKRYPLGYGCPKPTSGGLWATGNTSLWMWGTVGGRSFANIVRDPCQWSTSDLFGQILVIVNHDPSYRLFKEHLIKRCRPGHWRACSRLSLDKLVERVRRNAADRVPLRSLGHSASPPGPNQSVAVASAGVSATGSPAKDPFSSSPLVTRGQLSGRIVYLAHRSCEI
jgi:hypothetical protein